MTAPIDTPSNSLPTLDRRLPTESEARSAAAIAKFLDHDEGFVVDGPQGDSISIAPAVRDLIVELLGHVSARKMVALVPYGAKLTTPQAAELLGAPHHYVVKLMDRGEIACVESGNFRMVPLPELMEFREERVRMQEKALSELARLGQECDRE